jgi:hypothetical protein
MKTSPTWIIIAARIGIQSLRVGDDVAADLGEMKIRNWSKMAMDREEWERIVQKAKIHIVVAPREEHGSWQRTICHTILKILRLS